MRCLPWLLIACSPFLVSGCTYFEGGALGRKYVVFFNRDSAALDAPARTVVRHAAAEAADNPSLDLLVEGYAAANGSISADAALSAKRAQVVARALGAGGVAANRIQVRPRGPSNENPGLAARRVEIDFGH